MGRKFTIFALFYFVFEGKFHVQAPQGLIFGGRFNGFFFCVTILRGLYFRTFTVCHSLGSQTTSLTEFCSSEPLPPYTISTSSPPPPTYLSFFSGSSNFSGRRFKYFVIPENNIGSALCREFSWSILVA